MTVLLVCNQISQQGIRTNVTLIFSIPQAILAAKAGATYVSPFVGRLDDQQVSGLEVVRGIAGLVCTDKVYRRRSSLHLFETCTVLSVLSTTERAL